MNQQLKLQHQITLIYRYFQEFLCGGWDNFDIFKLSALGREILITVKTKICPFHYFVDIYPTGKNDTPNESAAQTTTPDSIDLQILSIVFVWWLRQFWHFHLVGTGPWNFNCCRNTNFAGPLFWCFSSYRRELCTKWISSSNCIINKLWFTATFNSFCMVTQTILTFSPCRHWTVKY